MKGLAPMLTVLMPVFNGEKYLREAIDSILGQTLEDFELLIIDDGSDDRSVEIIRSYSDGRIRLETNQGNQGIARTLNRGMRLSAGRYVARMDSDDVSLSHRLERLVNAMEGQPDLAVCGSWLETFGIIRQVWRFPLEHEAIRARMLFESSIAHASAILRRDFFVREGLAYSEGCPHAEDYDLWVRAGARGRLANLPEVLYRYRHYEGQTVRRHNDMKVRSADTVRAAQLRSLGLEVLPTDLQLHSLLSLHRTEASWETIDAVESWLGRVAAANRASGNYDQRALDDEISSRWMDACRRSASLGLGAWTRFKRSSLRTRGSVRAADSMRFLAKCLLKGSLLGGQRP